MSLAPQTVLDQKRRFALERAERLKDPKMRQMGIDKTALDDQVREKQELAKLEKDREDYFNRQAVLMDRHAQVLQQEVNELRMNRERGVNDYRNTFQKRENGREWDLNDPSRFRNEVPARVGDDDPRGGVSSLQKFEGEDLDYKTRKVAQADQQRQWAQAQIDEKLMKKWMERDTNQAFEDRSEEMAYRTWQVGQKVAEQRSSACKTTADFNKALSEQKKQEAAQAKFRETQRNMEEIHNMLTSDLLTEKESVVSPLGETLKAERFKGFTTDQRRQIVLQQAQQREELRLRQLQEAEDERQLGMQQAMDNRMALTLDRQRQREQRAANADLAAERKQQASEAADRRRRLDAQYSNAVGEEFFKPFGQCL
eukprot:GILI01003198.1.p1 GENE.GILI01003198.1~~GILI01003198.1.p1  ORF type:complete len:369 (-),score=113.77 GILI01003198.1:169-1275(-)